jgi:hypothetical protein
MVVLLLLIPHPVVVAAAELSTLYRQIYLQADPFLFWVEVVKVLAAE